MQQRRQSLPGDHLGQEDADVRAAVRFAVAATAAGVGFLVVAAWWASACGRSVVDTVTCGAPQRILLALGSPAILFAGGIWAFVRTYRVWRAYGTWWGWQGAGWFLLMLMVVMLTLGFPVIAGPVLTG